MGFWNKIPMLRLFIPFVFGIFIVLNSGFYNPIFDYILIISIGLLLISAFVIRRFLLFSYEWIFGIVLSIALLICGMQSAFYQNELNQPQHFSTYYQKDSTICIIEVEGKPILKEKTIKVFANVCEIRNNKNQTFLTQGHLLLYFKRSGLSEKLQANDILCLNSKIDKVKSPMNPGEFDYQEILKRKNVFFQSYANDDNWHTIKHGNPCSFGRIFADIQLKLYSFFDNENYSKSDASMLGALILGYTDDIDAETVQAFSNTGIIHVLSVSGMHVGLIFLVITYLLKQIPNFKRKSLFDVFVSLLFLWVYALISGFSPCVVRASLMFSFVVLANSIGRYNNIYNTLFASAFLILVFDPNILFNIGFQLSYLAIFGIVWLQPELNSLFNFRYKILNNIWSLITVSLVAQLFTFPLTTYYFHQFPNYFLIANLIVLPLTTVIMYLGILLLIVSPLKFVSNIFALIIGFLMKIMMQTVVWIEHLPYSVMPNIPFSKVDMILSFAIVLLIAIWFSDKRRLYFNMIICVFAIWTCSGIFQYFQTSKNKQLIVYSIKGRTALDFIQGKNHVILSDDSLKEDEFVRKFYLQSYWTKNGLRKPNYISFDSNIKDSIVGFQIKDRFVQFCGTSIYLLKEDIDFELVQKQKIDYVLVMNSAWFDLEKLKSTFEFKKVLIDGSNSYKTINFVERKCKENNIPFMNLAKEGALIINI